MRKAKVDKIFRILGEIRGRKSKIGETNVLELLYLGETQTLIIQITHIKVGQGPLNPWGKGQENQLNVGEVEENRCFYLQ